MRIGAAANLGDVALHAATEAGLHGIGRVLPLKHCTMREVLGNS